MEAADDDRCVMGALRMGAGRWLKVSEPESFFFLPKEKTLSSSTPTSGDHSTLPGSRASNTPEVGGGDSWSFWFFFF